MTTNPTPAGPGAEPLKDCSPDSTPCARAHVLPLVLLFIFLAVIYANSFEGAWIFDDESNIVQNPYVHMKTLDWEGVTGTFESIRNKSFDRPLAYLSFGLNYFFHGLDTWGYHLVNLIIHCLSALFLYLFIFKTLRLPGLGGRYADRAGSIALLATVLWATSPIQVTSVTFIVQRMASMAGMFFIMAMFFYLMGRTAPGLWRKSAWLASCLAAGFLSLASKENAVMLPVVLYLLDILLIQGVSREKLGRQLLPAAGVLIFLAAAAFLLTDPFKILSGYSSREFTLMERLLTQPRILVYYLSLMLYPITDRFTLIYEVQLSTSLFTPWTTIPAILFWAGWTGLGIYLARIKPLISFCLLFFVINHLLESSFIPLELIYEHRNYIPSMTIFLLISMGVIWFLREFSRKRLLHVLTALVIVVTFFGHGHTVMQRNALFEHPLLLWADNAEKSPGLSRVYVNMGREYSKLGMDEEAKDNYLKALEVDRFHRTSLKAVPYRNLGSYFLEQGKQVTAIDYYLKSLRIDNASIKAWFWTIIALLQKNEISKAEQFIKDAENQIPDNAYILTLKSIFLHKKGMHSQAISLGQEIIKTESYPAIIYKVLGNSYLELQQYNPAKIFWEKYMKLEPENAEAILALTYIDCLVDPNNIQGNHDQTQDRIIMVDLLNSLNKNYGMDLKILSFESDVILNCNHKH